MGWKVTKHKVSNQQQELNVVIMVNEIANPNSGTKNSISITVTLNSEKNGTMRLWYTANETENIDYHIHLVSRPSNLGKGVVWYFVCPKTGKLCRKLYYRPYLFVSRFAFNLMYRNQIESKKMRKWQKMFGTMYDDFAEIQIYKKYFKTHYRGKPTKKIFKIFGIPKKTGQYRFGGFPP